MLSHIRNLLKDHKAEFAKDEKAIDILTQATKSEIQHEKENPFGTFCIRFYHEYKKQDTVRSSSTAGQVHQKLEALLKQQPVSHALGELSKDFQQHQTVIKAQALNAKSFKSALRIGVVSFFCWWLVRSDRIVASFLLATTYLSCGHQSIKALFKEQTIMGIAANKAVATVAVVGCFILPGFVPAFPLSVTLAAANMCFSYQFMKPGSYMGIVKESLKIGLLSAACSVLGKFGNTARVLSLFGFAVSTILACNNARLAFNGVKKYSYVDLDFQSQEEAAYSEATEVQDSVRKKFKDAKDLDDYTLIFKDFSSSVEVALKVQADKPHTEKLFQQLQTRDTRSMAT